MRPVNVVYEKDVVALKDRILALIPSHPEILGMDSAWGLFDVPGFKCDDIGPSLAQASAALAQARHEYRKSQQTGE